MKYSLSQDKKDKLIFFDEHDQKHILYRIIAVEDIVDFEGNLIVKKGAKGGYIENEHNLSQAGKCWIGQNAKVFGNAKVYNHATVSGFAIVCDYAKVFGYAKVYGHAKITDDVKAYDWTEISGHSVLRDEAEAYHCSTISGRTILQDKAKAYGNAKLSGYTNLCDSSEAFGYCRLHNVKLKNQQKITEGNIKCNLTTNTENQINLEA